MKSLLESLLDDDILDKGKMKNLKDILVEEIYVSSQNTMGMGNPMPPVGNEIGSEPIIPNKKKKNVRPKHKN